MRASLPQGDYLQGRHARQNHPYFQRVYPEYWAFPKPKDVSVGEGLYMCTNRGSCIAPDTCSCPDGYEGVDCSKSQCRHRNQYGNVVGCLHGSVCAARDTCKCPRTESVLAIPDPDDEFWIARAKAALARKRPGFVTGYMGSDCSIPICMQVSSPGANGPARASSNVHPT